MLSIKDIENIIFLNCKKIYILPQIFPQGFHETKRIQNQLWLIFPVEKKKIKIHKKE